MPYYGIAKYCFPSFNTLKTKTTTEQTKVLEYFETYPLNNVVSGFSSAVPYSIIYLNNAHFAGGTVRIRTPGVYILEEDITFEPNSSNDFFPTRNQIISGLYPMGTSGPYHLGFFAAITIEADNVILDLNGKTIQQSKLHNLQQRFYANIELASAPFIPTQGPADFGDSIKMPTNVLVMNGHLGLSSHHGIHGNGMKNVILKDITFSDMEVAAIALNGAENSILLDLGVSKIADNIHILSSYSQGRFIRSFLTSLQGRNNKAILKLGDGDKDITAILSELNNDLDKTKEYVLANNKAPFNIFGNSTQLYDGNVYGIVLNIRGVVVNDFITVRNHSALGNKDIYMENITIKNIISQPVEIIAINSAPEEATAYSGKRMVGPVGDVFNITLTTNKNVYESNTLANAQLILAKYNDPPNGTTNIEMPIVEWAEKQTDINTVLTANDYYYVDGGDSMGHTMKGNIGLFISCGLDIKIDTLLIDTVESKGTSVGTTTDVIIQNKNENKQGAAAIGIMITGSENITLSNVEIKNIKSENGNAKDIEILSSHNVVQTN